MCAHGWDLAGVEIAGAGVRDLFSGKTLEEPKRPGGVEVGEWNKFLQRADWKSIDRWIATTSESASYTSSSTLEKMFKDAANFWDKEKNRGFTPKELAAQIMNLGFIKSEARAKMLAHTGAIWSYNEGAMQRYDDAGVSVVEWLTADDDLRCPFCAEMNGKRVETKEPFFQSGDEFSLPDVGTMKIPKGARGFDVKHPPLHPNCLIGNTAVCAPDKLAAFVAAYCGPVIEVGFSDGRRLTVTPNHMFLTPFGFARAASLCHGDDVIDCALGQRIAAASPHDHSEPAPIRDIVEAFAESRGVVTRRVPAARPYLHGDGAFIQGDVYVIAPDSFFQCDAQAALAKSPSQRQSGFSDPKLPAFNGCGDLTSLLFAMAFAADGGMSFRRENAAFSRRHAAEPNSVRGAATAHSQAAFAQSQCDHITRNAERRGERKDGFAGNVPAGYGRIIKQQIALGGAQAAPLQGPKERGIRDAQLLANLVRRNAALIQTARVVFTRVRDFCDHVYDLQTASSVYLAEGVIASNCRCTILPIISERQLEGRIDLPD
jgi:hypothetical protein